MYNSYFRLHSYRFSMNCQCFRRYLRKHNRLLLGDSAVYCSEGFAYFIIFSILFRTVEKTTFHRLHLYIIRLFDWFIWSEFVNLCVSGCMALDPRFASIEVIPRAKFITRFLPKKILKNRMFDNLHAIRTM